MRAYRTKRLKGMLVLLRRGLDAGQMNTVDPSYVFRVKEKRFHGSRGLAVVNKSWAHW